MVTNWYINICMFVFIHTRQGQYSFNQYVHRDSCRTLAARPRMRLPTHRSTRAAHTFARAQARVASRRAVLWQTEHANTRKQPVRFDSFLFSNFRKNIVSVPFGLAIVFSCSMRFGLRFLKASWFGPVRFGSVPRPVPRSVLAGSEITRFGSVRFGRFGSVSYCFLECQSPMAAPPPSTARQLSGGD